MPEIKRTFQAGKMNRSLDERLVKPGEYVEALNVNIGRSDSSDIGAVENILGNTRVENPNPITDGTVIGSYRDNGNERIYFFVTNNEDDSELRLGQSAVYEYDQRTNRIIRLVFGEPTSLTLQVSVPAHSQSVDSIEFETFFDDGDALNVGDEITLTEDGDEYVGSITAKKGNEFTFTVYDGLINAKVDGLGTLRLDKDSWLNFHVNYSITGINLVDGLLFWTDNRNEPRKINVVRARNDNDYYNSDDKTAVAKFAPYAPPTITRLETGVGIISNFLQEKLVRFAYRFKYNDGEYSTISPLTPIAFTSASTLNSDVDQYTFGEVPEFVNDVKRVDLSVEIPVNFGITGVEFLYNESTSSNIYIIEEISANTDSINSDPISVNYVYESQDPFRVLPGNQLTRVYDAVPRRAKSQEFAGGRLIYGDYLQNYNLPSLSFQVTATDKDDSGVYGRFSVKSRRTYQVGVVLADRYGRQSPVILSSTGNDTIFVEPKEGLDAMQNLNITFNNDLPDWAYSYRIVIKQRQQEYYNWFWNTALPNIGFGIDGNTINIIPRDTTQETIVIGTTAIAASTVKVFEKYNNGANLTGTDASLPVEKITVNDTGIHGFVNTTLGNHGVFETEPVESELDIFFETSTGALVSSITQGAEIPIEFYNCWVINVLSAGHLEFNRIKAGFNAPAFNIGVKAYVVQENFAEQRRFNTLIHSSGLFNSRVGINYVNQFNETEGGLTISLDPTDGSIQKLYAEDTQLLIFQEDKVSRSPIDKDFIYSAEGGSVPVTSSTQYLGTVAAYAGEYGISRDPESFAVYGTRKYFSDKNRGVILRLSNDGLTEISEYGMTDFFRDALRRSTKVVGSFDEYHDNYNITIIGNSAYAGFEDTNIATGGDGYFTVSFEEEVGGWPSFKSFEQEGGLTLNNRFYTLNGGDLWEHNTGTQYNNFYNAIHESYIECVMNDSPSDVKEFKTINYEGDEGWICDTVDTDTDSLRFDPDERQLQGVVEVGLDITEDVQDGEVFGIQSQTIRSGESYKWVIRVQPATSSYIFEEPENVIVTFDGEALEGVLNEDNNFLYFVTEDLTSNVDITHTVTINGAAIEDVSGAILTIRLVNELNDPDLELFIPGDHEFSVGLSSFAYVSSDIGTDIEIGVRLINDEYEIFKNVDTEGTGVINNFDDSINALKDGDETNTLNLTRDEIIFNQLVDLPDTTTVGAITVLENPTIPILRDKQDVVLKAVDTSL